MPFQTVIFDLFHTLVSIEESAAPGPSTHELVGVSYECWRDVFYTNPAPRYIRDDLDLVDLIQKSAAEAGAPCTRERAAEIERIRTGRFYHAVVKVPQDVLDDLGKLKSAGIRLGLLSDVDAHECTGWADSPLREIMDAARFSCHSGVQKPDPAFYRMILEDLKAAPEETLFVGDGGSNELVGAKEAGLTPVLMMRHLLRSGELKLIEERRPLAKYAIKNAGELLEIVDED